MARDVVDTFATHSGLVHGVTGRPLPTKWLALTVVFLRLLLIFVNKRTRTLLKKLFTKYCQVYMHVIPSPSTELVNLLCIVSPLNVFGAILTQSSSGAGRLNEDDSG